ncbi:MAG: hypothetical protein OXC14_04470, partial [Rhodospirillaceae bacterium]|nr:hypothetical protein [Rhodospirillaceae bacterium]
MVAAVRRAASRVWGPIVDVHCRRPFLTPEGYHPMALAGRRGSAPPVIAPRFRSALMAETPP